MTPPVTLVTADATLDNLSSQDYRDIYDELRGRDPVTSAYAISLDKFVTLVTSGYSKAQWSKYHNGETTLTRTMRNELRAAVGLPLLPPTVIEVAATVNPDAAVWRVGQGRERHVIVVGGGSPITLYVNGTVSAADGNATMPCLPVVTTVTQSRRRAKNAVRPFVSKTQMARQNCLYSQGIVVSWRDIINAGLDALEREAAHAGTDKR